MFAQLNYLVAVMGSVLAATSTKPPLGKRQGYEPRCAIACPAGGRTRRKTCLHGIVAPPGPHRISPS